LITGGKASDERLTTRPSKDKGSIGEIILWARLGDYGSLAPQSLALFRLLRSSNLQFLEQLAPEQWECFGIHAERGRITLRDLATHMAGHNLNHTEQIRKLLR
jgi:DinB family protein